MAPNATPSAQAVLDTVTEQFRLAAGATKCHGCGCLAGTVEAMGSAVLAVPGLGPTLDAARAVLKPRKYDCLGCEVCYPAVAANAFQEAFPDALATAGLCPTEAPDERAGWPPLPGDYSVVRYSGSVAVCTLNTESLVPELARLAPPGLAIAGTMHTENLGIERVIRNVIANPNIRFLVLCGEDTKQLVGHLPGQCLESLHANGLEEKQRIVGARGKRPFVKNVSPALVDRFRKQVRLVSMIGELSAAAVGETVARCNREELPPYDAPAVTNTVETVHAKEPHFFKSDPAGFLVVYLERRTLQLVVEHYTPAGVLDCVVAGATPVAIYYEVIKRGLLTQLDHAAYLGRELATAERTLHTGEAYVQDRAPGVEVGTALTAPAPACGSGCTTCH
jgi:tetrahydromethanopterin S-methyltransferase subunit A